MGRPSKKPRIFATDQDRFCARLAFYKAVALAGELGPPFELPDPTAMYLSHRTPADFLREAACAMRRTELLDILLGERVLKIKQHGITQRLDSLLRGGNQDAAEVDHCNSQLLALDSQLLRCTRARDELFTHPLCPRDAEHEEQLRAGLAELRRLGRKGDAQYTDLRQRLRSVLDRRLKPIDAAELASLDSPVPVSTF